MSVGMLLLSFPLLVPLVLLLLLLYVLLLSFPLLVLLLASAMERTNSSVANLLVTGHWPLDLWWIFTSECSGSVPHTRRLQLLLPL